MNEIRTIRDTLGDWRYEHRGQTGELLHISRGHLTEAAAITHARLNVVLPWVWRRGRRT